MWCWNLRSNLTKCESHSCCSLLFQVWEREWEQETPWWTIWQSFRPLRLPNSQVVWPHWRRMRFANSLSVILSVWSPLCCCIDWQKSQNAICECGLFEKKNESTSEGGEHQCQNFLAQHIFSSFSPKIFFAYYNSKVICKPHWFNPLLYREFMFSSALLYLSLANETLLSSFLSFVFL